MKIKKNIINYINKFDINIKYKLLIWNLKIIIFFSHYYIKLLFSLNMSLNYIYYILIKLLGQKQCVRNKWGKQANGAIANSTWEADSISRLRSKRRRLGRTPWQSRILTKTLASLNPKLAKNRNCRGSSRRICPRPSVSFCVLTTKNSQGWFGFSARIVGTIWRSPSWRIISELVPLRRFLFGPPYILVM